MEHLHGRNKIRPKSYNESSFQALDPECNPHSIMQTFLAVESTVIPWLLNVFVSPTYVALFGAKMTFCSPGMLLCLCWRSRRARSTRSPRRAWEMEK
ncbi:hypothetical protein BDW68DRAFT_169986 [Aspergillus falconensis]